MNWGVWRQSRKEISAALLRGKNSFAGHSLGKQNFRLPHCEKKKFRDLFAEVPFLIGLYKDKNILVYPYGKKILGGSLLEEKKNWGSLLEK